MNKRQIAEFLLQSKAIKIETASPFSWASGWKSPIYCDNRKTLSYPDTRSYIRDQFVEAVKSSFEDVELIAGVATGAIAQGALVADKMDLPFVYVRSAAKKHGMENLIEGFYEKGQRVVVIEDLISTGGSSLKAVEALREAGCEVLGMVATFTYGFEVAEKNFKKHHLDVVTLLDYESMLQQALESGYIQSGQIETLKKWRLDPSNWTGE
jgi:orotate phosphoribosyltransferase